MDPNTISPPPQNNSPSPNLFSSPSLPNLPDMPPPPTRDKKSKLLIIAGVVLAVIVAVGLAGVFLSPKNESPTVQQVPTFNTTSETITLSEQLLKYLTEDKLNEAVAMIKPEGTQTRAEFEKRVLTINYVKENYSTAGCETEGSTSKDAVVVYTCKDKNGKEVSVQITARNDNGKTVLSGISIIGERETS